MDADFWHAKWKSNEIGFHLSDVNPLLVKNLPSLNLEDKHRVFLPLCGKTLDIAWLLAQGYEVVGVELSKVAVEALFESLGIKPEISQLGHIELYSAPDIDIFVGDFFELSSALLHRVDAVYDRAALVALPEGMRTDYTKHLTALTNSAPQLLVTFEYDQNLLAGPPFSISEQEIKNHYEEAYGITLLERQSMVDGLKGKYPAEESVWYLAPK